MSKERWVGHAVRVKSRASDAHRGEWHTNAVSSDSALSNLVCRLLDRARTLTVPPTADLEHERAWERERHRANTRWNAVGSVAESQLSHLN